MGNSNVMLVHYTGELIHILVFFKEISRTDSTEDDFSEKTIRINERLKLTT